MKKKKHTRRRRYYVLYIPSSAGPCYCVISRTAQTLRTVFLALVRPCTGPPVVFHVYRAPITIRVVRAPSVLEPLTRRAAAKGRRRPTGPNPTFCALVRPYTSLQRARVCVGNGSVSVEILRADTLYTYCGVLITQCRL